MTYLLEKKGHGSRWFFILNLVQSFEIFYLPLLYFLI